MITMGAVGTVAIRTNSPDAIRSLVEDRALETGTETKKCHHCGNDYEREVQVGSVAIEADDGDYTVHASLPGYDGDDTFKTFLENLTRESFDKAVIYHGNDTVDAGEARVYDGNMNKVDEVEGAEGANGADVRDEVEEKHGIRINTQKLDG